MTLHQLKVFATVAKLRNFTQAAENLHVSQPSVTLVIQGLGRELEIKLFERLGNKVRLTTAGERLLHHAEEILTKVDGIKEEIDEIRGLKKGKLSVGGSALAAACFLPGAVQNFKKEHPGVEVILRVDRSRNLERKLLEGELDVAILGRAPCSVLLLGEAYREEELVVIAPPQHPLSKRRSVPLELVAKEPFIAQQRLDRIRDIIQLAFAERGLPFEPVLEVDAQLGSWDAIKSAVISGIGAGFIPRCHIVSEVKAGRLKVLKVPELKLKMTMYIAVHKNREGFSLNRAFIEFLRRYKERR